METEIYDHDYKAGKPHCVIDTKSYGHGGVIIKRGTYWCIHGSVVIYAEQGSIKFLITTFSMIFNGREYHRTISKKSYTDIGIARKAGEFVKYVLTQ